MINLINFRIFSYKNININIYFILFILFILFTLLQILFVLNLFLCSIKHYLQEKASIRNTYSLYQKKNNFQSNYLH